MKKASALLFLFLAISVSGQSKADFTGHWREQSDAQMQRDLNVEQTGGHLRVKTLVAKSQSQKVLEVEYEIGGGETIYRGLDGDEFHSSVHWDGAALAFEIIEHEGGSEIPQKTIWTLS